MANNMHKLIRAVVMLITLAALSGCGTMSMVAAHWDPHATFVPLDGNPSVRYESDSEQFASMVAVTLKKSQSAVEKVFGADFPKRPLLLVCRSSCFDKYVINDGSVGAAQVFGYIYLNPDRLETPQVVFKNGVRIVVKDRWSVEQVLTHELTHLMLYQQAGVLATFRLPRWFNEGLAAAVSGEDWTGECSLAEVKAQILNGRHIRPNIKTSFFDFNAGRDLHVSACSLYSQSAMFVRYLQTRDHAAFASVLHDFYAGKEFQESIQRRYGLSTEGLWGDFVQIVGQGT